MGTTTAAFYDLDGTLLRTNVVHAYAYYAVNLPSLSDKLLRSVKLAASLPMYFAAEKINRKLFNDLFYRSYKGISEDRLVVLGEEMFENMIRPALYPAGIDLVRRSRNAGHVQVLVTGALDFVARPIAHFLGMDHFAANVLEYRKGYATGAVIEPVLAGPAKAAWMRRFAGEQGVDLESSYAYADSYSDYPMLSMVGRPCAVNPDPKLRAASRAFDWPVVDLGRRDLASGEL